MAKTIYFKTALIGGAAGALDSIDGVNLLDGDIAQVNVSDIERKYVLTSPSSVVESSPDSITPDTNPADKRWILQSHGNIMSGNFTCTSGYNVSSVFNTNVNSSSKIIFSPVNSAGALAVSGNPSPFISALHPGSGFAFSTKNGSHFVGTEIYDYLVFR